MVCVSSEGQSRPVQAVFPVFTLYELDVSCKNSQPEGTPADNGGPLCALIWFIEDIKTNAHISNNSSRGDESPFMAKSWTVLNTSGDPIVFGWFWFNSPSDASCSVIVTATEKPQGMWPSLVLSARLAMIMWSCEIHHKAQSDNEWRKRRGDEIMWRKSFYQGGTDRHCCPICPIITYLENVLAHSQSWLRKHWSNSGVRRGHASALCNNSLMM